MKKITLHAYATSPFAMKVHSYLLFKNLDFTVHYVNPIKVKSELPVGHQIPVLTIDNESKADSQRLCHWLDVEFPDTQPLTFGDEAQRQKIVAMDDWINAHLIPYMFLSVYPRANRYFFNSVRNSWTLGKVVCGTTESAIPKHLWTLWPMMLRGAGFIRTMVAPYKNKDLADFRQENLNFLENTLSKQDYLASSNQPSLADVSAWPLLMAPYQFGLIGADDIINGYPNINAWISRMAPFLNPHKKGSDKTLPPLVPLAYCKRPTV